MLKNYRKKNVQPMRPYEPGEDMTGISVNKEDTPELGGMIDYRDTLSRIDILPKKPRGAGIGKFGGDKQMNFLRADVKKEEQQ